MNSAVQYRQKAAELLALASTEHNPNLQVGYAAMAQSYFRLAVLAESNSKNDIVYETPALKDPQSASAWPPSFIDKFHADEFLVAPHDLAAPMDGGREYQREAIRQQKRPADGKLRPGLRRIPGHAGDVRAVIVTPDGGCEARRRPWALSFFMRLKREGHDDNKIRRGYNRGSIGKKLGMGPKP
jgi:hypothetical protein